MKANELSEEIGQFKIRVNNGKIIVMDIARLQSYHFYSNKFDKLLYFCVLLVNILPNI